MAYKLTRFLIILLIASFFALLRNDYSFLAIAQVPCGSGGASASAGTKGCNSGNGLAQGGAGGTAGGGIGGNGAFLSNIGKAGTSGAGGGGGGGGTSGGNGGTGGTGGNGGTINNLNSSASTGGPGGNGGSGGDNPSPGGNGGSGGTGGNGGVIINDTASSTAGPGGSGGQGGGVIFDQKPYGASGGIGGNGGTGGVGANHPEGKAGAGGKGGKGGTISISRTDGANGGIAGNGGIGGHGGNGAIGGDAGDAGDGGDLRLDRLKGASGGFGGNGGNGGIGGDSTGNGGGGRGGSGGHGGAYIQTNSTGANGGSGGAGGDGGAGGAGCGGPGAVGTAGTPNNQSVLAAGTPGGVGGAGGPACGGGTTYSVSGNVFLDTNNNKIKDGGESNYTDGSSSILLSNGSRTDTISNNSGTFSSSGWSAGSLTIQLTLPSGYTPVHPPTGPFGPAYTVTLGPGCIGYPAPAGSCDGSDNINELNFAINTSTPPTPTPTPTSAPLNRTTTTTISSSLNPSTSGQTVTFSSNVNGVCGPTGTVTYFDGGAFMGSGSLSGGSASFSTSGLSVGNHNITASYGGNAACDTSNSPNLTQTVNAPLNRTTTTTISSSLNPSTSGQTVTFSSNVNGVCGPTGTVTYFDGGAFMGSGSLSGGSASFSTSGLSVGNHNITASYGGNAACDTSNSPNLTQTVNAVVVNQAPTITNATISTKPVYTDGRNHTITLTATDPDGGNDIGTMYGIINYQGANAGSYRGYVGWTTIGSFPYWSTYTAPTGCPTGGGQASVRTDGGWGDQYINLIGCSTSVSGNTRTVNITVSFNSNFTTPSTNNTITGYVRDWGGREDSPVWKPFDTFDLAPPPVGRGTTTSILSSLNPSTFGDNITFGSAVSGACGPTGTVTFLDGGSPIGSGSLSRKSTSFGTSSLSVGNHNITASYGGNANCDASSSPVLVQTVNAAPPVNQQPTVTNVTISSSSVKTDGTNYTITITGTDNDGGNDIGMQYVYINHQGVNGGNYRGHIGWSTMGSFPYWSGGGPKAGSLKSCSGSGQAAIYDDSSGGYGSQYINLLSCSAPVVVGSTRVINLVVTFNPGFTTPTTNNTLSGFVQDWSGLSDGWKPFSTFDLELPPPPTYTVSGNVFVDTSNDNIKNGSENYTGGITITSSGGSVSYPAPEVYTISNLLAGTYTVSYNSIPPGYSVYPAPPAFSVTVGVPCSVANTTTGGRCDAGGNVVQLNFALHNSFPWIQGYDLDFRFDNGFTDKLPAGKYALTNDTFATTPGVVFTGDVTADFGAGQPSTTNRIVGGNTYPEVFTSPIGVLHTSYNSLLANALRTGTAPINMDSSVCGAGGINDCNLNPGLASGIYQSSGNLNLNAFTFNANKNMVFLVNGTLTVKGNIIVSNGVVLFSSNGDIIIDKAVGSAAGPKPLIGQVQGFYSADRNFILGGFNNCSLTADKMLNVDGAIVINAGALGGTLQNNRDLCVDNASYPAFTISPRLDMVLNAPPFLMQQSTISKEVAP